METDIVEPKNTEADFVGTVTQIWGEALGVAPTEIAIDRNYFEMGGTSLSSMVISQKIRNTLGKDCTPRHLYENPTVLGLTQALLAQPDIQQKQMVAQSDKGNNSLVYFSGSDSQFMIWMNLNIMKNKVGNINAVFKATGIFDKAIFSMAANAVLARHDTIWSSFFAKKPALRTGKPSQVTISEFDISSLSGEGREREFAAIAKTVLHGEFNLSAPPLVRICVVTQGDGDHSLLISLPHIISFDGSIISLCKEIFEVYDGMVAGAPAGLEPEKFLIGDIVEAEKAYMNGSEYEAALKFYSEKLTGIPPLFFDRACFTAKGDPGSERLFEELILTGQQLSGLQEISRRESATVPEAILTLLALSIHDLSGQIDVPVWMAVDTTQRFGKPPVIDNLAAPILVRSTLRLKSSYAEHLRNITSYIVDAFSHIGFPGPVLNQFLAPPIPKNRYLIRLLCKIMYVMLHWFIGKGKIEKKIIESMANYVGGEIIAKGNMKKLDATKQLAPSIMFNVLPGFFDERVKLGSGQVTIDQVHDFWTVKDHRAFVENSTYMDSRLSFFALTRNTRNEAVIYMSGGGLNRTAYSLLKERLTLHLNSMLENSSFPIPRLGMS